VLLDEGEKRVGSCTKPLLRRRRGRDRGDRALEQLVDVAAQQRLVQIALGGKVLVDQRLGDPSPVGNPLQRRLVESMH